MDAEHEAIKYLAVKEVELLDENKDSLAFQGTYLCHLQISFKAVVDAAPD